MEKEYLITFFTHYGAMQLIKALREEGITGRMMPVPRALSSNCGACVAFAMDNNPREYITEDAEALYEQEGEGWVLIFSNE